MYNALTDQYGRRMPTQHDYRQRARALAGLTDDLTVLRSDMSAVETDPGAAGSPYADALAAVALNQGADIDQLGAEFDNVIHELDRRADLCEQYTADMRQWRDRHDHWNREIIDYRNQRDRGLPGMWPGTAPVEPTRPFPAAEEG